MLKLAMIGTGGYAYELIKRIWKIPDKIELIAVSSNPTRKSAGRRACMERGIPVYADVDELLSQVRGKCSVIFVPTPIHTHFELCKKCIEKGFDVFLEKPPVATIQELDELVAIATANNKDVAVAFQSLYSPVVQSLKAMLLKGKFGRIKRLSSVGCWPRDDSYYNRSSWAGQLKINGQWVLDGTVNNPFAHMLADELYLASSVSGKMAKPVSIQAELYKGHDIASEDTSSLRIITADDVEILFNTTLCPNQKIDPVTVIECEKAVIEYSNFSDAEIKYTDGTSEIIQNTEDLRIHMLCELARCYEQRQPYAASLDVCRPFTICVNGAFESSGGVNAIDAKYIKILDMGESVNTVIEGISESIIKAHQQAKLFSQMAVPWAVESRVFNVPEDYSSFPSQPLKL